METLYYRNAIINIVKIYLIKQIANISWGNN